jgi:hypothetical protein
MESLNCAKCISIQHNCKVKKMCNKCKQLIKLAKDRQEHIEKVANLKELVKTNPKALLDNTDAWSEYAICVAVTSMPSIASNVKAIYHRTRCHINHSDEKRTHIYSFLDEKINEYYQTIERQKIFDALLGEINKWVNFGYEGYETKINELASNPSITYSDWIEIIKKNPWLLKCIPSKYITEELCSIAMNTCLRPRYFVPHNPLYYVPDRFKTEELCFNAVKHTLLALYYFPERLRNIQILAKVIKANKDKLIYGSISYMTNYWNLPEEWQYHPDILDALYEFTDKLVPYNITEEDILQSCECAICYCEYQKDEKDVVKIKCGHIWHKSCIQKWVAQKDHCPLCRKNVL